ncbi:MAG: sugar ABC transporter permease [Chloroflexi bacterium]|nr:sugar ABC transporter permease [Chloroflexota bacterium]MCL5109425.1 sugar ABC transporter permease [Chloroflexota bacterium]
MATQEVDQVRVGFVGRIARSLRQGDIGSLPVLLGLVLIAIVFQIANPNFLTPLNLTNLMVQISALGTIAVGVVLVLLIGEIDLSVGAVSGLCAAIMAVLSAKNGLPASVAVPAGLVAGSLIGLLQGSWFAKLRVPSFVVTLAGYLGWQGVLLYVLGDTGTVNLTDPAITGIANTRLPLWLGWALGIVFVVGYAVVRWNERRRRGLAGVKRESLSSLVVNVGVVAIGTLVAVAVMSVNRNPNSTIPIQGVPSAVVILLGFVVLFNYITERTAFGRHVFAVGGNVEAARRAGINVDRVRITVFVLTSTLAAAGGILAGSRLLAVNQSSGGGDLLLNSIAAAVIGGTSLFGGRGSTWAALLGALVIGAIANGMDLLGLASSIKFIVTGVVLLLAITIDAVSRSRREVSGR